MKNERCCKRRYQETQTQIIGSVLPNLGPHIQFLVVGWVLKLETFSVAVVVVTSREQGQPYYKPESPNRSLGLRHNDIQWTSLQWDKWGPQPTSACLSMARYGLRSAHSRCSSWSNSHLCLLRCGVRSHALARRRNAAKRRLVGLWSGSLVREEAEECVSGLLEEEEEEVEEEEVEEEEEEEEEVEEVVTVRGSR